MNRSIFQGIDRLAAAILAAALLAMPASAGGKAAEEILSEAAHSGTIESNLRVLCDEIGGRMPGTPALDRAVSWAVKAFQAAGADRVATESFVIPNAWSEGETEIAITSPIEARLRGVSSAWVPATPKGGIEAEAIDGGSGSEGYITRLGKDAQGRILVVRSSEVKTFHDLAIEQRNTTIAVREAVEAGAAAVLFVSTRPNGLLYRQINIVDGKLEAIPTALIAREDGLRLLRLIDARGKVRVRVSLPNKTSGPTRTQNVVAEIRGGERPEEYVLVGAHLDSWDLGAGCLDNGCNVALVIEIARTIAASKLRPKRSIRFVLFSAEEQGLLGSEAYVRAHRGEFDNLAAVIIHDMGDGKVSGYSLGGRRDIEDGLVDAMEPVAGRGANAHSYDAFFGTDHFDFLLEGVPTLVAIQDTTEYVPTYHSSADTFDKVSLSALRDRVSIAAVTVFNLADSETRLGKRLGREEVERLVDETGLDDQMKFLGLWDSWADGARGRAVER
jgi:Zn-dependent M28 family amino/carboxypeptidase